MDDMDGILSEIADIYTGSLTKHDTDPRGVGWRSEEAQQLRFAKLAEVMAPESDRRGVSINDLGCGYGALFYYLESLSSPKVAKYTGYDISTEMVNAARRFVNDKRAEFYRSYHITQDADYSFASGTFYVRLNVPDLEWMEYVKSMIHEMAERSRKGFAFNMLSSHVDWRQTDLFYADPGFFFDFCRREISKFVALLHDYPLYEWTMLVRKGQSGK